MEDQPYTTRAGRTVKFTEKMAELAEIAKEKRQSEINKREQTMNVLYDSLQLVMEEVCNSMNEGGTLEEVEDLFKNFNTMCASYYRAQNRYLNISPEDEIQQRQEHCAGSNKSIDEFTSYVQGFLSDKTQQQMRDDMSHVSLSTRSQASRSSRDSARSNVSLIRIQERQKQAELSAKMTHLKRQQELELARKQLDMEQLKLKLQEDELMLAQEMAISEARE